METQSDFRYRGGIGDMPIMSIILAWRDDAEGTMNEKFQSFPVELCREVAAADAAVI